MMSMYKELNANVMCRLCLRISELESNISIFSTYKGMKVFEHIKAIANVDFTEKDVNGLPSTLCDTCYGELKVVINFRIKCEISNLELQSYYHNPRTIKLEKDIKPELDIIDVGPCAFPNCTMNIKIENLTENLKNETLIEKGNVCEKCSKAFASIEQVHNHTRLCKFIFQCDDCKKFFKTKCKLKVHWKQEHLKRKLFCNNCKRHYKSYKALYNHKSRKSCRYIDDQWIYIEGVDRQRKFCCKKCPYKSSVRSIGNILVHIRSHTGERPYKCSFCDMTFVQISSLHRHEDYKHKKLTLPLLTCDECGKTFVGKRRMLQHLSKHRSPDQKCTVCNKIFKKDYFKIHMLRHSGTKNYVCEFCASPFYTLMELCNHKKQAHSSHTKTTETCKICGYKPKKENLSKNHMLRHSKFKHGCGVCGIFFNDDDRFNDHKLRHAKGKNYECPHCNRKYLTIKARYHHISKKHSELQLKKLRAASPS